MDATFEAGKKMSEQMESQIMVVENAWTFDRLKPLLVATFVVLLSFPGSLCGQTLEKDPRPLIDREPFERIVFATGQSYDIEPMNAPDPLPKRGKADFRLLDEPDPDYAFVAPWNRVAEVKTFAQLILEEAKRLEKDEETMAEAYRFYNYLLYHPQFEGKRPEIDLFPILVRDAVASAKEGEWYDALVCFEELKRNHAGKRFSGLGDIKTASDGITACYRNILNKVYEQRDERQVYQRMRRILSTGMVRHSRELNELNEQWTETMNQDALKYLGELEQALADGKPVEAQDTLRKMRDVSPTLPQLPEFEKQVRERYPMVIVGVDQLPPVADPRIIESWPARRTGKLLRSQLFEFVRQDEDGGIYDFPYGRVQMVGEDNDQLRFTLSDPDTWGDVPPMTSIKLARLLEAAATPGEDFYHPLWNRILESVEVEDPDTVNVQLRYPFLLPTSMLQIPLLTTQAVDDSDGPYELEKRRDDGRVLYRPNSMYVTDDDMKVLPRVLERRVLDATQASQLLQSGAIDILERVYPGEIPKLQRDPDITVRRYQIPTVHWLIPNLRRPGEELPPSAEWVNNPLFRRGLLYAIDRDKLVNHILTNEQPLDGYEVISGPFPVGIDESDPLMYANDFRIKPLPHNQDLGRVFVEMTASQIKAVRRRAAEAERKQKIKSGEIEVVQNTEGDLDELEDVEVIKIPLPRPPELVLAYPKGTQAETICSFVVRYWKTIGVSAKLRELPEGQYMPEDDNWDFVFTECSMQEPLVDARRIFGQTGLIKTIDASVEQALDRIDRVRNWQSAGSSLRNLHEKVFNEVTILPLWQVPQYYAYRSSVRNIGYDINSLYQNASQWRTEIVIEGNSQIRGIGSSATASRN